MEATPWRRCVLVSVSGPCSCGGRINSKIGWDEKSPHPGSAASGQQKSERPLPLLDSTAQCFTSPKPLRTLPSMPIRLTMPSVSSLACAHWRGRVQQPLCNRHGSFYRPTPHSAARSKRRGREITVPMNTRTQSVWRGTSPCPRS